MAVSVDVGDYRVFGNATGISGYGSADGVEGVTVKDIEFVGGTVDNLETTVLIKVESRRTRGSRLC